jgi:hypothetical protein
LEKDLHLQGSSNGKRFESLHKVRISGMTIENENFLTPNEEINQASLPPPLFDDTAAAKAQPVQPLSPNRVGGWLQRMQVNKFLTRRVLAFAIVIASGVVAGAAGGAMLVKQRDADNSAVERQTAQPNAAVSPGEAAFEATTIASESVLTQPRRKLGRLHKRGRVWISSAPSAQRAYKVATIR